MTDVAATAAKLLAQAQADPALIERAPVSKLVAMLRQQCDGWHFLNAGPGAWLREEYVLRAGIACIPQKLPKGVKRGTPKLCFYNARALVAARRGRLSYCEGFALRPPIWMPLHHAWAVDNERRVVDPTWDRPETGEYLGVPFDIYELRGIPPTDSVLGVEGVRVDWILGACPELRELVDAQALNPKPRILTP